jgi:hypothetical protein
MSPLVLLGVMQGLAELNRKVDALAKVPQQAMVAPTRPKEGTPEEAASPQDTTALAKIPRPKVNRSRLLDFFD